jgi:oligosaccharide amylase
MTKELVLGNGRFFINYDAFYNLRDLYFPHVGKNNHCGGHPNGLGVWVGDRFSWIDASWERHFSYEKKSLCTLTVLRNEDLGVELRIRDCIHKRETALLKAIEVNNLTDTPLQVRLGFYHWYHLEETAIGNTVYYHPKLRALLHYKGRSCILISADRDFTYTTAQRSDEGSSWKAIETGEMNQNPIVQGDVDSALMMTLDLPAKAQQRCHYQMSVGHNFDSVSALHQLIAQRGVERMMEETVSYWRAWIREKSALHPGLPLAMTALYSRSLLLIRAHMDHGGAILAANDTDIYKFNKDHYSYMWPRDGAFTAITLAQAGYGDTVRSFFEFCARHQSSEGYLMHKYSPDGTAGSSWHPWCDAEGNYQLPIQEDETALVVAALGEYYRATKDIEFVDKLYDRFTRPAADFMLEYRDESGLPLPSYDLWEERRGVMTYTCATVYAGLQAATYLARLSGSQSDADRYEKGAAEVKAAVESQLYDTGEKRFVRGLIEEATGWFCDMSAESSVAALFELGMFEADDPRIINTMNHLRDRLWIQEGIGGVARYEGDYYHRIDMGLPGNPWIVTTLWLANWYTARNEIESATRLLEWVIDRRSQAGLLAEQFNPLTGEPLSVNPLTWSHAAFCFSVQKLSERLGGTP